MPPILEITLRSGSAFCGTSTPMIVAPSRASVSAIEAPIPRAAPVTSAVRPASGRLGSLLTSGPVPIRATWPSTYADLGERKKRSVESSCSWASGATYTRLTVAPRFTSLPRLRVKPSRARCAMCCSGELASSGVRPTTMTRPAGASWRTTGEKKRCRLVRSAVEVAPVASKTIAFGRIVLDATPSVTVLNAAPMSRSSAWTALPASVSPIAPKTTGPSITGLPSVQRGSGVGSGRPRFFTSVLPSGVVVKVW